MKISLTFMCMIGVVLADDRIKKANEKVASVTTENMNQVSYLLQQEMASFEKVTPATWANKKYYSKETPVSPAQVCMVEKVVNQCFKEQVDLTLNNLKSVEFFDILLTNAYFETGNPHGKLQKDNVGRLLQAVSNTGHGLTKNLIGWLHKSHSPGKGQPNACSTRALGFGDYAHTFYKGAYNVAFDTANQLRIANGEMAALLNKDYTESDCLEQVFTTCNPPVVFKKEQMMTLHKAILLNLDTELDFYHSDGKTDFKGNRNTRTYIKDVTMGPTSQTSFGLMNLAPVTLYKITSAGCGQSTLDSKYASAAKTFAGLKEGTCAEQGCTVPDGKKTISVPVLGDITAEAFKCSKKSLVNLDSVHDGPVCEGSYFKLGDVDNHNVMVFAPTGKNCVNAGTVSGEAGSMTIFKGLQNLKFQSKKQKRCDRLEQKSRIPTFWGKTDHDVAFRYAVQTEIDQLGCY